MSLPRHVPVSVAPYPLRGAATSVQAPIAPPADAAGPDTRIRVLFTIPNFDTAGTGRAMLSIVERLDRTRFAPAVAVRRTGGELATVVTERLGLPLFVAPTTVAPRPLWSLPWRAYRASAAFRGGGFSIWHSFHYADDYTEPLIARLAGARHWVFTKKNDWWGSRAWRMRSRLASRIVALNSAMSGEFFEPLGMQNKVVTIPRGVDTSRFRPDASREDAPELRRELPIPAGAPIVVCCAILVARKNHRALIAALNGVPRAHLVLAGPELEPDYVGALRRQAHEAGLHERVHFLGPVRDVPGLLTQADAFALPSLSEGMPVALLEAMAAGLPCVATAVAGARDIVEPEVNGLLVPVDDVGALRTALTRLVADETLRRRLGTAAAARVRAAFDIDAEARAHAALYESLVATATRS